MIGIPRLIANVHHWATVQPTTTALIQQNNRISYAALREQMDELTALIGEFSLPPHAIVAVNARKTPQFIALILAMSELAHPLLIVPEKLGAVAKRDVYARANVYAELSCEQVGDASIPRVVMINEAADVTAHEATTFILTTSGTTGVPKGVRLSHCAISNFFRWAQTAFSIGPGTTILSYAPLNFDLSLLEVWAALDAGATVVLANADLAADAVAMQKLVSLHAPDLVQGVPLLYKLLLQHPTPTFRPAAHIIVTGESTPHELRQSLAEAFPAAHFHNVYGSTETNDSFMFSANAAEFTALANLPIGTPIAETRYRIIDDHGEMLSGPGVGELHTSTPFAASGYTDARLTDVVFYEHDGHRYYRTGDIAERRADGRRSHQSQGY
jgi:D-alanine--poly(phosphoribitol) ligase subunit 1